MKKITGITLCNYRAFLNKPGEKDKYKISLPKGENLLIYGENGSGKSSLFKGLKDFFDSANNAGLQPNGNIFSEVEYPETEVKIQISEKQEDDSWVSLEELIFSEGGSTTATNTNLLNSTNSFLTYRDILETYFLDRNNEESPNLFNLFFEVLLTRLTDDENNQDIVKEIKGVETSIATLEKALEEIKIDHPELTNEEIIEDLTSQLNTKIGHLNGRFIEITNGLLTDTNNYLNQYFNSNVNVGITNPYEFLSLEGESPTFTLNKKLKFYLYYFNNLVEDNYSLFLNEARLSAIAICMYLAAVKKEGLRIADNLKILFLDDIFIGVDTSNRIPLLEILAADFNDFQIFLSTYDREWFELAKNWIERKSPSEWLYYEFYADDYSFSDKEIPKIKLSKDHLALATYYYKKSDFSASGNYLRKACEETFKKILPSICLKGSDGMDMTKLSNMLESAKSFFKVINQPTNEIDTLAVYLQALMNPLSHYYISSSVFKKEIKEVEIAISKLLQLDFTNKQFKKILDKGASIKLSYQVSKHKYNVYEIKIKNDLWIYKEKNVPTIYIGNVECENEDLYEIDKGIEGQRFHRKIFKKSLVEFYTDAVTFENTKIPSPNITILQNYLQFYEYKDETKNWKVLSGLLVF